MRHEQFSVNELTVSKILNPYGGVITPGANPSGACDYYVDLNKASGSTNAARATHDVGKTGKSWDDAFMLVASAITASNTSIGLTANRWWARRNRIFVLGDGIDEDLTVLPEKCDVIGLGSDLYPFPRIIGHHHIALPYVACRLINLGFQSDDATVLLEIPAGCHGLQVLDCLFVPKASGTTIGLKVTDCACMKISGNKFQIGGGQMANIFGTAISLLGTIGHESEISFNKITATVGILTATALVALGSYINDNYIRATGLTINDVAQDYQVINNRLITDADTNTTIANGVVSDPYLSVGNIMMGTGAAGYSDTYPWAKVAS
jgi:hypothetical protein